MLTNVLVVIILVGARCSHLDHVDSSPQQGHEFTTNITNLPAVYDQCLEKAIVNWLSGLHFHHVTTTPCVEPFFNYQQMKYITLHLLNEINYIQ